MSDLQPIADALIKGDRNTVVELTQKAIDDDYAIRTPLKDGTDFYMWDRKKVVELLSTEMRPLSRLELLLNAAIKNAERIHHEYEYGNDKVASLMSDLFWDDIKEELDSRTLSKEEREYLEKELEKRNLW